MKIKKGEYSARSHLHPAQAAVEAVVNKVFAERGKVFDYSKHRPFRICNAILGKKSDFDFWFSDLQRDTFLTQALLILLRESEVSISPKFIGELSRCDGNLIFSVKLGGRNRFVVVLNTNAVANGESNSHVNFELVIDNSKPKILLKGLTLLEKALGATNFKNEIELSKLYHTDQKSLVGFNAILKNGKGEITNTFVDFEDGYKTFSWKITEKSAPRAEIVSACQNAVEAIVDKINKFKLLIYAEPDTFDLISDSFNKVFDSGVVSFTARYARNPLNRPEKPITETHRVPLVMSDDLIGVCVVHSPTESYLEYSAPTENKLHSYLKKTLRRFPDVGLELWQNETWVKTDLESL